MYDEIVGRVESQLIERALNYTGGDKLEAIKLLGTNPATFRSTAALKLLDLEPKSGAGRAVDTLIQPGMTMEEIEKEAIRRALDSDQRAPHGSRPVAGAERADTATENQGLRPGFLTRRASVPLA